MSRTTQGGNSFHASCKETPDGSNQEQCHPQTYGHIRDVENPSAETTHSQYDEIDNRAAKQHSVQEITDPTTTDE